MTGLSLDGGTLTMAWRCNADAHRSAEGCYVSATLTSTQWSCSHPHTGHAYICVQVILYLRTGHVYIYRRAIFIPTYRTCLQLRTSHVYIYVQVMFTSTSRPCLHPHVGHVYNYTYEFDVLYCLFYGSEMTSFT